MADAPLGPGWWQAQDGQWYPPEQHPDPAHRAAHEPAPAAAPADAGPPPGWWQAQDGQWYAPEHHPDPAHRAAYAPGAGVSGPAAGGPAAPAAGGSGGKGRRGLVAVAAILVVALIGGAVYWFQRDDGDDEVSTERPATEEDSDVPIALAVGDAGPDPFTTAVTISEVDLDAATVASLREDLGVEGAVVSGDVPGLYGGTRSDVSCDIDQLAGFLLANPAEGGAWAEALGIPPDSIESYVNRLTPVVLTADTWVTNHGFDGERATPFPAVLQAGTAVLIDDTGVPRVRCSCGNPLLEPDTGASDPTAVDPAVWDGYDAGSVVRTEAGRVLEVITLVDVETGERFDRAVGAGRTGDVQVTLRWADDTDLDLHVVDPDDYEIYYDDLESDSGGRLDVDIIPDEGDTSEHVENVFWPSGAAPTGSFSAFVVSYDSYRLEPAAFELIVVVDGEVADRVTGTLEPGEQGEPVEFSR